jgi:hypothetical protein
MSKARKQSRNTDFIGRGDQNKINDGVYGALDKIFKITKLRLE